MFSCFTEGLLEKSVADSMNKMGPWDPEPQNLIPTQH